MSIARMPTEYEQALLLVAGSSGIEVLERQEQWRVTANFDRLPRKINRQEAESLGFVFGDNLDELFVSVKAPEGWSIVRTDHSMWSNYVDEQGRIRGRQFYKGAFYDMDAFGSFNSRFYIEHEYEELPEPKMITVLVDEWKEVDRQDPYSYSRSSFDEYGFDDEYMFIRSQGMVIHRKGNPRIKVVDGVAYEKVKVKQQVPESPVKPWGDRTSRVVVKDRANPDQILFATKWRKNSQKPPKSYDIYNKPDYWRQPAVKWLNKNLPDWSSITAYW